MTEIIQADADHITITDPGCSRPEVEAVGGVYPPRSAVIVMDGERCECNGGLHEQGRCAAAWPVMPGEATYLPEQVRRLADPCPTCGGEYDEAFQWRDWQTVERIQDCQDCRGGKPTFTLHQRCPACNGDEWMLEPTDDDPDGCHCDACLRDSRGVIDLGDGWTIQDVKARDDGKFEIHAEQAGR